MKMTVSQRVLALALAVCLVLTMISGVDFVPEVQATADQWTKFDGTGTVTADTNTPTDLSIMGASTKAYYDKKIDVAEGTKIAFKVRFTNLVDNANLHYGFALSEAAGGYWNAGTKPNSIELELVSTVTGGANGNLQAIPSKMTAGGTRKAFAAMTSALASPRNNTDIYDVAFERINVTEGSVSYTWKLTVSKAGGTVYTYRYPSTEVSGDLFANGAYLTVANMGSGTHTVAVTNFTVTQPSNQPQWKQFDGAGTVSADATTPSNASFAGVTRAYYNHKIDVTEGTKIAFKVGFTNLAANANLHYGFALTDATGGYWSYGTKPNSIELELTSMLSGGVAGAVGATASKMTAGGTRTSFGAFAANLGSRSTTDVYDVAFERINVTEGSVNYIWKLTISKAGGTVYTYRYKATDLPQDLFKNGAYLTVGNMGSGNHTVTVSDFSVTVQTTPPPVTPPVVTPPAEDPAGWNAVQGTAAGIVEESAESFNASFQNYVTGYYNDKIDVQENTTISFKVQFPQISENVLLQYAFSLVDRDKSFYISDNLANSLSLELTSTISGSTTNPLTATASKKLAGGNRTFLQTFASALANPRNTTDVYEVTLKKIDVTEGGVNYSWRLTVTNGSSTYIYRYKATDIAHDLFENGAYLALGSMAGSTTHTVKVSDLKVEVKEDTTPVVPTADPAGWNVVQGAAAGMQPESTGAFNASFQNYVTGYYNDKIDVQENTTISFKVQFPQISENVLLQYAFSLVDKDKSFYISDNLANSLSLELTSAVSGSTTNPLSATVSKKPAGGSRTFLQTIASSLANPRNTTDVYTVTFRKVNITEGGVNYSWRVTVAKANGGYTYLVKASDVPHDLFENGAYLALGSMAGSTTHTVKVSDLSVEVKQEDTPIAPPTDPEGWNAVAGGGLTADGTSATIQNYGAAYYNKKIDIKENTAISFQVSLPATTAGQPAHYGFSLVDKDKSFYTSNAQANSMIVELQSIREVNKKWPVYAVFSLKNANAGRVWLANLGSTLSAERDPKATYTITYRKINETIDNINYSWYVTISDGTVTSGYGVKASDVPHDRFANGAYLAAGAMMSVSNHTVKITNVSAKVTSEKFDKDKLVDISGLWKIVRGYSGVAGKGLSYNDGKVTMEGFGGLAYTKSTVKNAVSVEFQLNNYDVKKGDFFSFGVVNKKDVYYNPNGQESQGIYVRIKEVQEKLSVVVYTVDKNGSVAIGELTSTTKAKGVKHYVTFFKEGGKWFVALDSKQKMRIDEKVDLKDVSYLVAGATMGKAQSMTVNKVTVDGAVTAGMKAGALKTGYKINGFQIVRGYGVGDPATGTGLTDKGGKTQMQGYGGIAYTEGDIKDAVAVDFEMNAYSGNSYFFSFGLLNKKGVYYNPNGQESQGIYVRIKSWVNGMGLNVTVYNLTKAGSEELGTITSKIPPQNQKHNLAIFKQDGVWYVGIDGNQKMQLNVDVDLGKTSYLCAGASTTPDLTMTVGGVYIDGKVTDAMKAGAVVMSSAADSQVGEGDSSGGTSTEKGDGNEFITQEGSDGPGNVVESTGSTAIYWIVGAVVICAALVAAYLIFFAKKGKKQK